MNIIVYSKDRASQLERFIRTMKHYFVQWDDNKINVIYDYSNKDYSNAYDIVMKEYNDVNFIKQKNFKTDTLRLINGDDKYTVFFVDDITFKNEFDLTNEEIKIFSEDKNILCYSLRLHPNLNFCYAINRKMPKLKSNIWNWRGQIGDFGYPMSLDGHIFRTNEILNLLIKLDYNNPNELESKLAGVPINKTKMICSNKSSIVNIPYNRVQHQFKNRHGKVTAKYLNDKFLDGYRISNENIDGVDNISCHQEFELILENLS